MKDVYISPKIHTAASDTDDYTYDDPVEPGKILELLDVCATHSALASTEEVHFLIDTGMGPLFLGEDAAIDTAGHPHWSGKVFVGEGQRVGVHIPDSAANDVIYLYVFGILHDREEWIKE